MDTTLEQITELQKNIGIQKTEIRKSIENNSNKAKEFTSALFTKIDSALNIETESLNYVDGFVTMHDGEQLKITKKLYHIFNFLYKYLICNYQKSSSKLN